MLLKKLTETIGVSGGEHKVRNMIIEEISKKADHIYIDKIGNIIAYNSGIKNPNKRVMLCAHMDEVGLIVSNIDKYGLIKFKSVGGLDPRILLSKVVLIGDNLVTGVIGTKAVHLLEEEEKNKSLKIKDLYIDIGTSTKEETERLIKIGDYIGFNTKYEKLGTNLIKAKALDDRVGCAILINMLDRRYDFSLYTVFTVQEEIGLRGAKVAAFNVNPDIGLVIEGTTCSDVPGTAPSEYATILGNGPAISIMDSASYSDKGIAKALYRIGIDNNIPVQWKKTTFGGNESGVIHLTKEGIRTGAISIPCRYIHSPVSVMDRNDFLNCIKLVELFLENIERKTLYE